MSAAEVHGRYFLCKGVELEGGEKQWLTGVRGPVTVIGIVDGGDVHFTGRLGPGLQQATFRLKRQRFEEIYTDQPAPLASGGMVYRGPLRHPGEGGCVLRAPLRAPLRGSVWRDGKKITHVSFDPVVNAKAAIRFMHARYGSVGGRREKIAEHGRAVLKLLRDNTGFPFTNLELCAAQPRRPDTGHVDVSLGEALDWIAAQGVRIERRSGGRWRTPTTWLP